MFPPRLTEIGPRGRVLVSPPREPDVLALVPPTEEIVHLDAVWKLDAEMSPLTALVLWRPTDPDDQFVRAWLLDFGQRVLAAARRGSR